MTTTTNILTNFCSGDALTVDHTVSGLPAVLTGADIGFKASRQDLTATLLLSSITTTPAANGFIVNPGSLQIDGTYTAEVRFVLTGAQTALLPPGQTSWGYVRVYPGPYTSEVFPVIPLSGGALG